MQVSPTSERLAYVAPNEAPNRAGKRSAALPRRFMHNTPPQLDPLVDLQLVNQAALRHGLPDILTAGHARWDCLDHSASNAFGVARRYRLSKGCSFPFHDPDRFDTPGIPQLHVDPASDATLGPFTSKSAFLLADWYWQSSNKSFLEFQKLIAILRDPSFSIPDVSGVNWRSTFRILGANKDDIPEDDGSWIRDDGWKSTEITIDVPFHHKTKDPGVQRYTVGKLKHRSIVSIIREKLSSSAGSRHFHYYPFKSSWKRTPDSPEVNLYGELYASQAFRDAHEEVQRKPITDSNRGLERVVVALMLWSDETHLTAFGGAGLWPCYMFFGNESKHLRGEPSRRLGQHIAYFLKLPDRFKDHMKDRNMGKVPPEGLFRYCKKVLFQTQWSVLLDRELVEAMRSGLVITCPDGQQRCFYPRIMSYSADYPEKLRIYGMRTNAVVPCHRCLIHKNDLFKLGSPADTEREARKRVGPQERLDIASARNSIAEGYAIGSKPVESLLQHQGLVPVQSAFSECEIPVNLAAALLVDILHEFEVGSWKTLFIHLIRLLDAATKGGPTSLVAELDARYRDVPAFGHDTIRMFPLNASERKRRAARDYEDVLQCSIPTFDGLLPLRDDQRLMALLYVCAQWHALAKLRLHNDFTLELLEYTTVQLGAQMRRFYRDTCSKYQTKESEQEANARASKEQKSGKGSGNSARKPASLNIFTIKFHYLGDYASIIRRYGTTDSYSSQTGELYHREPKSWYGRTDKNQFETQLSKIERRRSRLDNLRTAVQPTADFADSVDEGELFAPEQRYSMGQDQNTPINLNAFLERLDEAHRDPYTIGFIPLLKKHLLARILEAYGCKADSIAEDAWPHVVVQNNHLFSHKILRIDYTAYDMRRGEDVIHIGTPRCNVMLLNSLYNETTWGTESPYLYGKILGIFHANVSFIGDLPSNIRPGTTPAFHRIEFAWVQWYSHHRAQGEFALDRVVLRPVESGDSLAFLDPADIVRAVHLIPQFSVGRLNVPPPRPSLISPHPASLWKAFYINKFVDRDMFMRFQYGMSVGHTYMHTGSFPPPIVPSIPPDFDHCLDVIEQRTGGDEADSELSSIRLQQEALAAPASLNGFYAGGEVTAAGADPESHVSDSEEDGEAVHSDQYASSDESEDGLEDR